MLSTCCPIHTWCEVQNSGFREAYPIIQVKDPNALHQYRIRAGIFDANPKQMPTLEDAKYAIESLARTEMNLPNGAVQLIGFFIGKIN